MLFSCIIYFTVISTRCRECEIYSIISFLSRPGVMEPALPSWGTVDLTNTSSDATLAGVGTMTGFAFSFSLHLFKCSFMFYTKYLWGIVIICAHKISRDFLPSEYRKDSRWLGHKGDARGVFLWVHNLTRALTFFILCYVRYHVIFNLFGLYPTAIY